LALVLAGVPAVAQSDSLPCGAACLASVALYWDNTLPPGRVAEVVRSKDKAEHSASELCALAERLGLAAYAFQGTMEDIETQVRKGRPMIVMIRPHFVEPPFWAPYSRLAMWITLKILRPRHWVTVAGLPADGALLILDPGAGAYRIERKAFEKEWRKHRNICVLALPRKQVAVQEGEP